MGKKIFIILLSLIFLFMSFSACSKSNSNNKSAKESPKATKTNTVPINKTNLSYKGKLTVMHYATTEESQGSGGSKAFRTVLSSWEKVHPDIKLSQNILSNDKYKIQIATLAAANNLPDVFALQGMNTIAWANQSLILDMTNIIDKSPYKDDYDKETFYPFTKNNKIYGLPVLTNGTCSVVIYDSKLWKEAGFDKFPTNWDDVIKAKKYFANKRIDTIAFGNSGKWQVNSCFLSTIGNRFTGKDWFRSIIEKKGAKFTDKEFVKALKFTKDIFNSGIFNKDFNAIDNEAAREYYIAGTAAAFIGGNWDVYYIHDVLKGQPLYKNTKFAVLPQPKGAKAATKTHALGLGFSISLNSKLTGEKLAAATDLAYEVTGKPYADIVGNKYALRGLTKSKNISLNKFDQFTKDLYKYSYIDNTPCDIYDSFVTGAVWDVLNTDLQTMLNNKLSPKEVAKHVEKTYAEKY